MSAVVSEIAVPVDIVKPVAVLSASDVAPVITASVGVVQSVPPLPISVVASVF